MSAVAEEINLPAEIASGDAVRLIELARRFNVNVSTTFRWVQKGLPSGHGVRVRLEALRRGKSWITSERAIKKFFGALPTSTPAPPSLPIRTPSKRERDCARAKQAINEKYGI
jgi:hypothetical protein